MPELGAGEGEEGGMGSGRGGDGGEAAAAGHGGAGAGGRARGDGGRRRLGAHDEEDWARGGRRRGSRRGSDTWEAPVGRARRRWFVRRRRTRPAAEREMARVWTANVFREGCIYIARGS